MYNHTGSKTGEEKAEVSYLTAQEPLARFQTQTSSSTRTMDAGEARFRGRRLQVAVCSGGAHLVLPQRNLRPFTGVTVSEKRQLRGDADTGNLHTSSLSP